MSIRSETRQLSDEIAAIRTKLDERDAIQVSAVREALMSNSIPVVVDVNAVRNNPSCLKEFDPGYTLALKFWETALVAIFWGGVLLAFLWKWWIFIPTTIVFWFLHKGQDISAYQFTTDVIRKNTEADWLITSGYVTLPAP